MRRIKPMLTSHRHAAVAALIFDFDGVILESGEIKTLAFLKLFEQYPEHLQKIRAHHQENLGVSRFEKFTFIYDELLRQKLTRTESLKLGKRYSDIVLEQMLKCPFVPGALESLRALSKTFPLFVASGTPQEELRYLVEKRELGQYFSYVAGSPPNKEHLVGNILRQFELDPARTLLIGDGISDLHAAQASGVNFLARVTDEQRSFFSTIDAPQLEDLRHLEDWVLNSGTSDDASPTV